jgi:hypothetical protein
MAVSSRSDPSGRFDSTEIGPFALTRSEPRIALFEAASNASSARGDCSVDVASNSPIGIDVSRPLLVFSMATVARVIATSARVVRLDAHGAAAHQYGSQERAGIDMLVALFALESISR